MSKFNIRVYGIYLNERNDILLADERIGDFCFTKFPGGGLEFGEGTIECLVREWKEELNVNIEVLDHIYTTDYFQISAFDNRSQIISIYYRIKLLRPMPQTLLTNKKFDFTYEGYEEERFRFVPLSNLSESDLTLPIDKKLVSIIRGSSNLFCP